MEYKLRRWGIGGLIFIIIIIGVIYMFIGEAIPQYAAIYADTSIYEKPLEQVRANKEVKACIGDTITVGEIISGEVFFSEDYKKLTLTLPIHGTKQKAKMDIIAIKEGEEWIYKEIKVRVKKIKKTIYILKE